MGEVIRGHHASWSWSARLLEPLRDPCWMRAHVAPSFLTTCCSSECRATSASAHPFHLAR
eukprot:17713-Pyramimonas_sp.AAC.1